MAHAAVTWRAVVCVVCRVTTRVRRTCCGARGRPPRNERRRRWCGGKGGSEWMTHHSWRSRMRRMGRCTRPSRWKGRHSVSRRRVCVGCVSTHCIMNSSLSSTTTETGPQARLREMVLRDAAADDAAAAGGGGGGGASGSGGDTHVATDEDRPALPRRLLRPCGAERRPVLTRDRPVLVTRDDTHARPLEATAARTTSWRCRWRPSTRRCRGASASRAAGWTSRCAARANGGRAVSRFVETRRGFVSLGGRRLGADLNLLLGWVVRFLSSTTIFFSSWKEAAGWTARCCSVGWCGVSWKERGDEASRREMFDHTQLT